MTDHEHISLFYFCLLYTVLSFFWHSFVLVPQSGFMKSSIDTKNIIIMAF